MKKMKVAISGAGICGLYLAWKISQLGHEVSVFEKKGGIGKSCCSGLFSERILEFIPETKNLVQNRINSVVINFPRKRIKVNFSRPFFAMSHFELDNLVFKLAKEAGADIRLNNPLNSVPEGFERVIAADGANSAIRQSLNLKSPSFRLGILGFVLEEDHSDFVETWPTKNGFIWRIPRGKETEYGILEDLKKAKEVLEDFLRERKIDLQRRESALVPHGFLVSPQSTVAFLGDSMGLTKPWSGGGVIWSLSAAQILLKNFPDFLKYNNLMKIVFFPRVILSRLATRTVYFLGFNFPWIMPRSITMESDFLFKP